MTARTLPESARFAWEILYLFLAHAEVLEMPKRNLRMMRFNHPVTSICENCKQAFQSQNESIDLAEREIQAAFVAHKCQQEDASQAAAPIVREATED